MSEKPVPTGGRLQSGEVVLRPVEASDAELLRRWRGRGDVRIWFGDTGKIDADAQQVWMTRYLEKKDDAMFIIALDQENGDERPVGAVAIYDIDRKGGTAEYGRVMIGDNAARGKAVAERASRILCDWAFRELDLHCIVLWVMADNQRAIAIYERLGFLAPEPPQKRSGYRYMVLEKNGND